MYTVPGCIASPSAASLTPERRPAAQDLGHEAAVPWVEVLDHDEDAGKLAGSAANTWPSALRPPAEEANAMISNEGRIRESDAVAGALWSGMRLTPRPGRPRRPAPAAGRSEDGARILRRLNAPPRATGPHLSGLDPAGVRHA